MGFTLGREEGMVGREGGRKDGWMEGKKEKNGLMWVSTPRVLG